MKITEGRLIACSPDRNFVTLKICTDEGIYGLGDVHPGDAAGLRVDIDEKLAAKYPYQRAYLPVARKLDGTLTDW
jgi:L-alanine-DL-glutamate epimerase-like enolase superfamily enzyme